MARNAPQNAGIAKVFIFSGSGKEKIAKSVPTTRANRPIPNVKFPRHAEISACLRLVELWEKQLAIAAGTYDKKSLPNLISRKRGGTKLTATTQIIVPAVISFWEIPKRKRKKTRKKNAENNPSTRRRENFPLSTEPEDGSDGGSPKSESMLSGSLSMIMQ